MSISMSTSRRRDPSNSLPALQLSSITQLLTVLPRWVLYIDSRHSFECLPRPVDSAIAETPPS